MQSGAKIYFGFATLVAVLLGILFRISLPLTGDALAEYDYFFFQANHVAVYGEPAFWNPYLYIGQKISSGFLFHFMTAPDYWVTRLFGIFDNPLSFATIFSISRSLEWLLTYAVCFLLGFRLRLNAIVSFFFGTVICISYCPISQVWPSNIVIQFLWVIYFIFRFQEDETLANAIFMTLNVLYLFFSTKIVGLMLCLSALIILLIHSSTLRMFRRPKILIPCVMILLSFVLPAYLVVKANSGYYYYANRSTGSYLSFKGDVADAHIEKTQQGLNSDAFDMRGVLKTRDWSATGSKIKRSNLYMVQDIGGYGGVALHVMAVLGLFVARIPYKGRLIACMATMFMLARFPIILVKLPLPDVVVFLFNIRYFAFMFGALKCFTAIFAALGVHHLLSGGKRSLWQDIGITTLSAAVIFAGTENYLLVLAALLFPALQKLSVVPARKGAQVLAVLLILICVGELVKTQYQLITMKRNPDIVASARDRFENYPFSSYTFRSRREVNPIHPKYAFQNASHQLDTPLPVLAEGKDAGIWAFYMANCYHKLLSQRPPDQVNQLNGVDQDIISFVPRESSPAAVDTGQGLSLSPISLGNQTGDEAYTRFAYEVVRYDANHLEFDVKTTEPGSLRLSVLSDPDWNAWVDEMPVPVGTVDHCLQSIPLNSGQHQVKLAYDPELLSSLAFMLSFASLSVFTLRAGCVIHAAVRYRQVDSSKN